MRTDFYFDSNGIGKIHCRSWMPEGTPKAVVQIIHGIAEYIDRYDTFAEQLNTHGIAVVAGDHMGHGSSSGESGIQGFFHGGWFAAVDDTYHLLQKTMEELPNVPYFLFGHSMGSFMARTILCKYPDSGIAGCIICGTGWQPESLLTVALPICNMICKVDGEQKPSHKLQKLIFGGYNKRVEHPRTQSDWLSRDDRIVDAYIADPLCGFIPSAGLIRDMLTGIRYIERTENLQRMRKDLPVYFVSGAEDPVGDYGKGVRQAAQAFCKSGMQNVSVKLYPLCRHEILNEINREEVYQDIISWISCNPE